MPEVKYERDTQIFDCEGLDLNRPVDSVRAKHYPYLKNGRSYVSGRIEPRFGLTDIAAVVAGQTPVHSARRLNNPATSAYARIIGTGTHLAYGTATFMDSDSGYSGDPLALVPWKPDASPSPFMYVADRSRMRKLNVTGSLQTIGLAMPSTAPGIALTNIPKYTVVSEFDATAGWGQAGTAGAPTLISRTPGGGSGTTTTIAQILYDSGTTGWACVQLTSMAGVGRGERLSFATAAETATVQDVFAGKSASTATTIASIIYDAGTSGACSIALTTPIDQIDVNGLLRNSTIAENIRVVAKIPSPAGTFSIRAVTVGTFAAGNNIQVLPSLRIYLVNNHAAAENVLNDAVSTQITVGTGTLTLTTALDLSQIASGVPTQPDDYMSIGLRVDRPDLVTEIKVQLDVDVATNDFTRNYYTRSIRASDLTPSVRNLQPLVSTGATIIQRDIIDNSTSVSSVPRSQNFNEQNPTNPFAQAPASIASAGPGQSEGQSDVFSGRRGPSNKLLIDDITTPSDAPNIQSQQLESGDVQWVDVRFRIADLIRVGTDDSRTLQNVVKIQVLAIVTGTINLDMDSWWVGGGYGPDDLSVTASPYFYRYRARVLSTNVASNWSPATRLPANAYRQSVTITPTQYAAPTGTSFITTDFVLDLERFGGELPDWHYLGTTPNIASPTFADVFADNLVGGNPIIGNDNYQPWPIIGAPVSGTTGTVAGTSVNDSATSFNISWAPGTRIIINDQPYTLYRVISTSRLELVESAGSQSAVAWQVNEPTILAQPLPCLWQFNNTFFACGDTVNPGRLYRSNPNSETTVPNNFQDVTSPSEPLMNGVSYNIRGYVFSSEEFFQILPINNGTNITYDVQSIPNGKGLFSRWALVREPAPFIDFLSKDGIYRTTGGAPVSLTDDTLYPLFPNEGNLGMDTNGVFAPNIVAAHATGLRLTYYDGYTYFDYDTQLGGVATLALASHPDGSPLGWFWDVYTPNIVMHYGEEGSGVHSLLCGGADTHLYQYTGNSDAGTAFSMELTTPSRDQNDPRLNKLYGDIMVDADTQGLAIVCTPYFNNNVASVAAVNLTTATRSITAIPLGTTWQTYRNISLNLVVSISTSARPKLYIWEPRWTFESAPISAFSWEISPTSFGMENFKSIGICKITHVSSANLELKFTIDGVAQTPIIIGSSGNIYTQTIFRVPVMKAKLYKLRIDSETEFRLDTRDTFIEVKDWASDGAYQKLRVFGDFSLVEG